MTIVTWNANRVERYRLLWNDWLVNSSGWDIICLQEAGKPDNNWTPVGAVKPWVELTDETVVRRFTYTPPHPLPMVHIVHCQWMNRKKNHLVIITRTAATTVSDLSGGFSERPAVAIPVRLTWDPGTVDAMGNPLLPLDVLVGCVHIVSSGWAINEIQALCYTAGAMCHVLHKDAFLLVGDFNCDPVTVGGIPGVSGKAPAFQTHQKATHPLDYLVTSSANVLFCGGELWSRGYASSDHWLIKYENNGAHVTIM